MKREILLNHECIAIASQHGLGGLYEYAQQQHSDKIIRSEGAALDGPATIVRGFYSNPACGECGVIAAITGMSMEEDGLEGVRFFFQPHEAVEAEQALLAELEQYDEPQTVARFSVVTADA